jgi:chorismate lyase
LYAVQPSGYHPGESNWRDYPHYHNNQNRTSKGLPTDVRKWLLDPGSLTQRLIKASGGRFAVQILSQRWEKPRLSEAKLLSMRGRETAIVREVTLLCAGQPWVFARSVMPASSLTGRLRRLRKLDNSSLGEMLFRDNSMRRRPFQIALIDGESGQIPMHLRAPQRLWGRRCRFELANKPIMVSEIFLNTFRP